MPPWDPWDTERVMVGRLPPPPLVCADTHCLQTSTAPADLHCHCCAAAAFLVVTPLLSSPHRCYLPRRTAAAAFLAARPPLLSLPRGRRCLPCRAAAAAFLAARSPLPSCLPHPAAADPSRLATLRPSPCPPFQRVPRRNPCRLPTPLPQCRQRAAAALPPPPTRSTVALPATATLLPTAPALLMHCRCRRCAAAAANAALLPSCCRCRRCLRFECR
jgi:hypothetical protein